MHNLSQIGMITQMSAYCTPRMSGFQRLVTSRLAQPFVSFFDDRPGKLFDIEHIRVAILLGSLYRDRKTRICSTTKYIKFLSEYRQYVFETLGYLESEKTLKNYCIFKIDNKTGESVAEKLYGQKCTLASYSCDENDNYVYYGYGYGYFGKILTKKSYFKSATVESSTGDKYLYINADYDKRIIAALMNSTLFYWYFVNASDGHNFTKTVIESIPFDYPEEKTKSLLADIMQKLSDDLDNNSSIKIAQYRATGRVEYAEYYPKLSKPIIDQIDTILAEHYGFTEEELDYIINYDIKYRMGLGGGEDDGDDG
jgi:hypothetical protein